MKRKSTFSHQETYGLGNFRGQALTTGCFVNIGSWARDSCYLKTEILDLQSGEWSLARDYPFSQS